MRKKPSKITPQSWHKLCNSSPKPIRSASNFIIEMKHKTRTNQIVLVFQYQIQIQNVSVKERRRMKFYEFGRVLWLANVIVEWTSSMDLFALNIVRERALWSHYWLTFGQHPRQNISLKLLRTNAHEAVQESQNTGQFFYTWKFCCSNQREPTLSFVFSPGHCKSLSPLHPRI